MLLYYTWGSRLSSAYQQCDDVYWPFCCCHVLTLCRGGSAAVVELFVHWFSLVAASWFVGLLANGQALQLTKANARPL